MRYSKVEWFETRALVNIVPTTMDDLPSNEGVENELQAVAKQANSEYNTTKGVLTINLRNQGRRNTGRTKTCRG